MYELCYRWEIDFWKKKFFGRKKFWKKNFRTFFFSKNFFRSNIQNLKHFPVSANIIGAGIFITPGTVLKLALTNGMALVVWLGCGLISLIGGICYIELGTSIRDPGCDFAYNVSGEFGKFAQKRGKIDFSWNFQLNSLKIWRFATFRVDWFLFDAKISIFREVTVGGLGFFQEIPRPPT